MAIPTIVASSGPFSTATTALTVTLPTHAAGDRIWIAAAGPVATVTAPSGWTEDTSLFLSGSGAQTNVFYLDATSSSETNPVFAAPVNHLIAVAITIRGGGAVDGYATATPTPATSANLVGPDITTTAADTLLLAFVGSGFDTLSSPIDALNSWGAATSTSVPVQGGTNLGNGSQVGIVKGESATAQLIVGLNATRHTATSGRYNVGVVALKTAGAGGITGTATITEANDTVSSASTVALSGAASITEANDTSSSTATVSISATASITEAGDTVASASALSIAANSAITEADDTLSSTALIVTGNTGQAAITEANDTVASAATVAITASSAITEANDTVSSAATVLIEADAAITEADDTLSATGEEPFSGITANASITEENDTLSSTIVGSPYTVGVANIVEAPDTVSSTAGAVGIVVSDKVTISDTENPQIMRAKVNKLLELYAPGFADALPDASLSPNGRLFYVGSQGYQNRNGVWIAL